jgi:hypothetical protein
MGEALPFMLDRIDETPAATAKTLFSRSLKQMIGDQVWIATSGSFTMIPLMAFGVDRLMFSVGLPFCVERAGSGLFEIAASVAGGQGEDRAWQRGPPAATTSLKMQNGRLAPRGTEVPARNRRPLWRDLPDQTPYLFGPGVPAMHISTMNQIPPTAGTSWMKNHQPLLSMSCSRRTVTASPGMMMAR